MAVATLVEALAQGHRQVDEAQDLLLGGETQALGLANVPAHELTQVVAAALSRDARPVVLAYLERSLQERFDACLTSVSV